MQYTDHYNLNLPEENDIVNPLIQDNPNYTAIDNALYANKLRVVGNATETKTGTSHTITRQDTDIPAFKFVATGDFDTGDTFTVDGVSVTARLADGQTPKNKAFVINSTVFCILDGTILNLINVLPELGNVPASDVILSNGASVESALIKGSYKAEANGVKTWADLLNEIGSNADRSKVDYNSYITIGGTKLPIIYLTGSEIICSSSDISSQLPVITRLDIKSSLSTFTVFANNTFDDRSNGIAAYDVYLRY